MLPALARPHVLNVAKVTEGWVPFRPYTFPETDSQGSWDVRLKPSECLTAAILAKEGASSGSNTQSNYLRHWLSKN